MDDLQREVQEIVRTPWSERDGRVIPDPLSIKLGNDAVKITATVLYADLADSTALVANYLPTFVAKAFKSFLKSCARVIQNYDGVITAYDGDRIMAVFHGERMHTRAALCGLGINWAMEKIVNPQLKANFQLPEPFALKHGVGIDRSDLFVVQTGIRGYNDLAWVGNAANRAAKMSSLREDSYATYITKDAYDLVAQDGKICDGKPMWENRSWGGATIFRSAWWIRP